MVNCIKYPIDKHIILSSWPVLSLINLSQLIIAQIKLTDNYLSFLKPLSPISLHKIHIDTSVTSYDSLS